MDAEQDCYPGVSEIYARVIALTPAQCRDGLPATQALGIGPGTHHGDVRRPLVAPSQRDLGI